MSTYDIQLRNLEADLAVLERRYKEHPTKANLRRIVGIKREIRDLKQGSVTRNPMARTRRRRRSRRRNPVTSGDYFLLFLGGALGVVGTITYQQYVAPKLLSSGTVNA